MTHTLGNMWVSNNGTHNILCNCNEVFENARIGTVVRMYAQHLKKEVVDASIR